MSDVGDPPLAHVLATPWAHPFVGRGAVLTRLERTWADARAGPGQVVVVAGEAGAGKTRLVGEFGRAAHEAGAAVLFGACDDDLALPYQPWVEAFRQLLAARPEILGDAGVVADLAPLRQLVGELEPRLADRRPPSRTDPDVERQRVYEAFAAGWASAAARWPTIVLLDDLHWAGAQTLALLRHLARAGLPRDLLVVATYRDTGSEVSAPLAACLAELHRHGGVTRVGLEHLDRPAVARYVADAVGHELDAGLGALAGDLWAASGGNAFYLGEVWRHVRDRGAVIEVDGRWVVRDPSAVSSVPDGVREVVAGRLAALTAEARRLLAAAALSGQRVDVDIVARALAVGPDDLGASLGELVGAGFLSPVAAGSLVHRFDHAIVRDTVDATIPPIERRQIHRQLAEALEQAHARDRRPVLPELSRHLVAAAPLSSIDTTVYYGRRAAAQAARAAAHDEAAAQLEAVLALDLPAPSRAELLVDLGEARLRAGAYRRSREASRAAFALAVDVGDHAVAAEAALVFEQSTHFPGLPGDRAVELLRRAIALNDAAGEALQVRLQAALGRALAISGDDGAFEVIAGAVSGAERIGDVEALLVGLQAVITAERQPRRLLAAASELERLAEARDDVWNMGYGCANQCRARIALGDLGAAADDLARLRTINAVGRISMFRLMALHLETILALAAGDFASASALAEQPVEEMVDDDSAAVGDGVHGVQLFAIRRAQGRLHEVAPALRLLESTARREALWRPGLAALYAELGLLEDAARVFNELGPPRFATVPRDALWPACLAYLAETCVALADRSSAASLLAELEPFGGTSLTVAFTMCFGPADRLIADLLELAGQPDAADARFAAALDLARGSGSPLWTAEVLFDWAAALAGRGDQQSAAARCTEADRLAAGIGMGWRPRRPESHSPVRPLPAGLSRREVEVLRLAAAGLSNRAVGERLYISSNTVANHMRAILRKTGCANRTEATTFAHRAGLLEPGSGE